MVLPNEVVEVLAALFFLLHFTGVPLLGAVCRKKDEDFLITHARQQEADGVMILFLSSIKGFLLTANFDVGFVKAPTKSKVSLVMMGLFRPTKVRLSKSRG